MILKDKSICGHHKPPKQLGKESTLKSLWNFTRLTPFFQKIFPQMMFVNAQCSLTHQILHWCSVGLVTMKVIPYNQSHPPVQWVLMPLRESHGPDQDKALLQCHLLSSCLLNRLRSNTFKSSYRHRAISMFLFLHLSIPFIFLLILIMFALFELQTDNMMNFITEYNFHSSLSPHKASQHI